jgi:hypothetical protein
VQTLTDPTSTRNALAVITSPGNRLPDQAEPVELSRHDSSPASLLARLRVDPRDLDPDQYDRVEELVALGWIARAERVALCGLKPRYARCRCKLARLCPRCGRELAARRAERAAAVVSSFASPRFVTLELVSEGFFGLAKGLDSFRDALRRLRRQRSVARRVRGAVAGLEPHYARDGSQLWAIHAHLILDAVEPFEAGPIAEAWHELVGDRGSLLVPPQGSVVDNAEAAARYLTKSADWCPAPHSLPLSALRQLTRSMRSRHTYYSWGTGRRPRPSPTGERQ